MKYHRLFLFSFPKIIDFCPMDIKLRSKISRIKAFVFDIDGVFTDAKLLIGENSVERFFNMKDGYAVQMAAKAGYKLAVISGGKQESIRTRMRALSIEEIHLAVPVDSKAQVMSDLLSQWKLTEEEVMYMGDDIPDLLLMQNTELFKICPADAAEEVIEIADYVCTKKGGDAAVREAISLIMKTQNTWMKFF